MERIWSTIDQKPFIVVNALHSKYSESVCLEDTQAHTFEDTFCYAFTVDPGTQISTLNPVNRVTDSINQIHISHDVVLRKLESLRNDTSPGADAISPMIQKKCASNPCVPLTTIMNKSLETGTVPDDLKLSSATPIYKKGDKLFSSSNRTVSHQLPVK